MGGKCKYWYIKERHNPQIGVYYIALGNISQQEAKKQEGSIYGDNYIHRFNSEKEYNDRLDELNKEGHKIRYY